MSTHDYDDDGAQYIAHDYTRPRRGSIDESLELERQLDMESLPTSPSDPRFAINPSSLDPAILASLVTQLRLSGVELEKERDELVVKLNEAFAREELDRWQDELGRELRDGWFGENLTTEGLDLERLLINQRLRVGPEVVLEVSVPRTPCATFAAHVEVPGWVRRFAAHGRCGVYLRVVVPGTVRAGDAIALEDSPGHDVDMLTAFAAAMGDDEAARRVVEAACLPQMYHQRYVRRLAARA